MAKIIVKLAIFCVVVYLALQKVGAADTPDETDECLNHRELKSQHRSISYYNSSDPKCDGNITIGWYRFTGNAGRMMPTKCVPKFHCSAYGPGWLDGDHPLPHDGRVIRRVCFHTEGECCRESIMIQVRNCGEFMVYHLSPPPKCPLRYCGNEVKEFTTGYTAPNECQTYSRLNATNRAEKFYDPFKSLTDAGLTPGWYRFEDDAGGQMADKCPDLFHCGTHATGWLNGDHPAQHEGAVMREVCFHWLDSCCQYKQQVLVRRCKHFYVYELPGTVKSYLRYCGNGTAIHNRYHR